MLVKQHAPLAYGIVFKEDFANINNWTNIGSGSFTPGGTGLTIGAGITDYLRWLEYDPLPNTSENFLIEFQVEVLSTSGILATSVQTRRLVSGAHKKTFIGAFVCNPTTGRVVVATYADGTSVTVTNVADASPGLPNINYSVGHILNYAFRRSNINDYTCTVFNTNNSETSTVGYTQIPDASPVVVAANNACKWSVQCVSGSWRIIPGTFQVTSSDFRNVRAVFVGDSRTTFMSASPATARYPNLTFSGSKFRYAVDAGAYDTTGQYSIQGAWINSFGAEYVIIAIGRNDIFYGIASGTWQANLNTIRNNAVAGGAKAVFLLFPNDTSATVSSTLNAYVLSTFTSDIIIDMTAETLSYSDGVHFSNTGHQSIATFIRNAMPWLY